VEQEIKPSHNLSSRPIDGDGRQGPPDDGTKQKLGPWLARNAPYLLIVLVLFLWFCIIQEFDPEKIFALFKVALGLGLVIFVHELGHFLVAKWCDVHVETFSIGFGPPIPGCVFRRGETTYMIALFPLGGYVKMVGEGPEEEHEDDPRSFKNKPVWQRMAIISAGVAMNLLLAFGCFVFVFRTHGAERPPGEVERVDPGSPAWTIGMRSGDVIYMLGNKGPRPYFNEIQPTIINSEKGEELKVVFGPPNLPEKDWLPTPVVARRSEDDTYPMIGISPPHELKLWPASARKIHELPVLYSSAAAKANPSFEFGDSIMGTTDPDYPNDLDRIIPLKPDPRCIPEDPNHLDYFEFQRRLHRLAGQKMVIQVRRQKSGESANIHVPPAYYYTLGLRMPMGKILAVRNNSPAALAGLKAEDIIERVEMTAPDGRKIRFPEDIKDPLRLPYEMEKWAKAAGPPKAVTLTVSQATSLSSQSGSGNFPERRPVTRTLHWQDGWEFNEESPFSLSSPLSIPGLGIAYRVETTVLEVEPGLPASRVTLQKGASISCDGGEVVIRKDGSEFKPTNAERVDLEEGDQIGLKKGDVIKALRVRKSGKKLADPGKPQKWLDIKADWWAGVFETIQGLDIKNVDFRLERGSAILEVSLTPVEDANWPRDDRGLLLEPDLRLQKADSLAAALKMGVSETATFTYQIYGNLRAIITGRVSVGGVVGPLGIADFAFQIAGEDFYKFLLFLGVICVNLAVINFLPIPVLDGGHMAFLVYEWIRGKPAPEAVRVAATYIGLAVIASLMIFVIYLDVKRLL
jgi:regulator of sigma E protease